MTPTEAFQQLQAMVDVATAPPPVDQRTDEEREQAQFLAAMERERATERCSSCPPAVRIGCERAPIYHSMCQGRDGR